MRKPDAGRRSAARRRSTGQAKGRGPKAEGSEPRAQSRGGALGKRGAVGLGLGTAGRDGENDSFAVGASLLGFIELGP